MKTLSITELQARIAVAISEMEGYTKDGSLAQRNHNPGNLRWWPGTRNVDGYAFFATPQDGWRALRRQVLTNVNRGLTLLTFFAGQRDEHGEVIKGGYHGYAPRADGNYPLQYAHFVAKRVGIPVDVPLRDIVERRESQAQLEEP